jgi:hypothetical protein
MVKIMECKFIVFIGSEMIFEILPSHNTSAIECFLKIGLSGDKYHYVASAPNLLN